MKFNFLHHETTKLKRQGIMGESCKQSLLGESSTELLRKEELFPDEEKVESRWPLSGFSFFSL